MDLSIISYPVYKLGRRKPIIEDKVVLYLSISEDPLDLSREHNLRIIDDKNLPGDSLAARRLYIRNTLKETRLHRLNVAIFFLGDLLKIAKDDVWFIDSTGFIFNYIKSKRATVEYRKIINKWHIKTGGALIELEGIPTRFKCLFYPTDAEVYGAVLLLNKQYIFYGVSSIKRKTSWKKV